MHDAGNICRVLTITNLEVKLKECILWEGCSGQEGFVLDVWSPRCAPATLALVFLGPGEGRRWVAEARASMQAR